MTSAERQQILQAELMLEVGQGNRVVWIGLHEAHVLEMPPPVNHLLHLFMTIFTVGVWAVVWLLVVMLQPEPKLVGVAVGEDGHLYEFVPQAPTPGRHRRRPVHS